MAEPSQAKPSRDAEQRPRERLGAGVSRGTLLCSRDQPPALGSRTAGAAGRAGAQVWCSRSAGLPRHTRAGIGTQGSHTSDQRHGETDF